MCLKGVNNLLFENCSIIHYCFIAYETLFETCVLQFIDFIEICVIMRKIICLNFFIIDLVVEKVTDLRDKQTIRKAIKSSVMSKQYGNEEFLVDLITDACSKFC